MATKTELEGVNLDVLSADAEAVIPKVEKVMADWRKDSKKRYHRLAVEFPGTAILFAAYRVSGGWPTIDATAATELKALMDEPIKKAKKEIATKGLTEKFEQQTVIRKHLQSALKGWRTKCLTSDEPSALEVAMALGVSTEQARKVLNVLGKVFPTDPFLEESGNPRHGKYSLCGPGPVTNSGGGSHKGWANSLLGGLLDD